MQNLLQSYTKAFENYFNFSGKTSRRDFWQFFLIHFIVYLVLIIAENIIQTTVLTLMYQLATFIPLLSITVRRMHDIDRTGAWVLISFIPIIGQIVILCFAVQLGVNQGMDSGQIQQI